MSTGTLFVYFDSKRALITERYVTLKSEMGRVAAGGVRAEAAPREQLHAMWDGWMAWATGDPDRRRALAHLAVAEDLTEDSRQAVHEAYAPIAEILRRIVADGPMRDAPLGFVYTLMSAIADATIDDLLDNSDPGGVRSALAFDAMWRALAGEPPPRN